MPTMPTWTPSRRPAPATPIARPSTRAAVSPEIRASEVTTGLVAGEIVLEDGRPTRIDEAQVLHEVGTHPPRWREQLQRLGSRAVAGCCPGG